MHSPRFAINCYKTSPEDNLVGEVIESRQYPESTGLVRTAVKRRYELLPYVYSLRATSRPCPRSDGRARAMTVTRTSRQRESKLATRSTGSVMPSLLGSLNEAKSMYRCIYPLLSPLPRMGLATSSASQAMTQRQRPGSAFLTPRLRTGGPSCLLAGGRTLMLP